MSGSYITEQHVDDMNEEIGMADHNDASQDWWLKMFQMNLLKLNKMIKRTKSYNGHTMNQGGDLSAGMQALPVGKIIWTKIWRKDNPKVAQICICWRLFEKLQHIKKYWMLGKTRKIGKFSYISYISLKFPKRQGTK